MYPGTCLGRVTFLYTHLHVGMVWAHTVPELAYHHNDSLLLPAVAESRLCPVHLFGHHLLKCVGLGLCLCRMVCLMHLRLYTNIIRVNIFCTVHNKIKYARLHMHMHRECYHAIQRIVCITRHVGVRVVYTQYQETRCMWAHQISELADPIAFLDDNSSSYKDCHYQRMLVSSCAVSLTYEALLVGKQRSKPYTLRRSCTISISNTKLLCYDHPSIRISNIHSNYEHAYAGATHIQLYI